MNLLRFILAMAAIILTWGLLFAIFTGLGLFVQLLMGLRKIDADHCLMGFWMGFACTIIFLQLWHLKMPVGTMALAIISAFGILGLLCNRRDMFLWLRGIAAGKRGVILAMLALTIWLANRSAGPCTTDDSGLYHISGVRWITEYSIVPGLGNLHGRLAFNNASFLYGALLETGPWYGKATHLANGLLLAVLGAQCILGGYRLAQPKCRKMAVSLFNLTLLPPLILTAVHSWISSYNTDTPTAILLFVAATTMFAFLLRDKSDIKSQAYEVIFVLTLLTAGVCVKVSSIFFSTAAAIVTICVWMHRAWDQRNLAIKTALKAAMMTTLLIVPWLARSIILSGYPLFPSTFAPMPVSWRVPENLASFHIHAIRTHARRNLDPNGWQWLVPWLKDLERDIIIPIIIMILGILALAWIKWTAHRLRHGTTATGWLLPIITLMAMAIWFLTAPARRFGYFMFWILAGSFWAMLFHRYADAEHKKLRNLALTVCLILLVFSFKKLFIMPPANGWLYPTPAVAADTFTTRSGLLLYTPTKGHRCWDMQLPCTPYLRDNLRTRRKGDLQSGFVLDGPVEIPSQKKNI